MGVSSRSSALPRTFRSAQPACSMRCTHPLLVRQPHILTTVRFEPIKTPDMETYRSPRRSKPRLKLHPLPTISIAILLLGALGAAVHAGAAAHGAARPKQVHDEPERDLNGDGDKDNLPPAAGEGVVFVPAGGEVVVVVLGRGGEAGGEEVFFSASALLGTSRVVVTVCLVQRVRQTQWRGVLRSDSKGEGGGGTSSAHCLSR